MDCLLIVRADRCKFVAEEVRRSLEGIRGVSEVTEVGLIDSSLRCAYEYAGDRTTVRLAKNLNRISVHGSGDASLHFVLELQRGSSVAVRVTDLDYGFDLAVSEIESVEDFGKKIEAASARSDVYGESIG